MRNPKQKYCSCGYNWKFGKLDYIRMVLFNKIIVKCPQCHKQHYYKLIYYAVEDFKVTNEDNKKLKDNSERIWKNG